MLVDVVFTNAKVFNVEHMEVVTGQKFTLLTDFTGTSRWFSDNDAVLGITQNGNNADVSADTLGESTILIFDALNIGTPLKTLFIKIVSSTEQAANLNTVAGKAVSK